MGARSLGGLCAIVLGLLVIGPGLGDPQPAPRQVAPARASLSALDPPVTVDYRGAPSCAATACHGAMQSNRRTVANAKVQLNEYTTWIERDKHANAYQVLLGDRSRAIAARLADGIAPETNARCLACHSTPAQTPTNGQIVTFLHEGVGCESCHGSAKRWYGEHTRQDWTARTFEAKKALGMVPTADLVSRAQTCAKCHVGAPAEGGLPARDVDHDLIAAGHPRLSFEFSAYLANMPPHWNIPKDDLDASPGFPARSWACGQVVSAMAALDLLRDRTVRISAKGGPKAIWPEFSEYGCFSCHHDLRDDPWRHKETTPFAALGRPKWGSWHYSLLTSLLGPRTGPEGVSLDAQLQELQSIMSEPAPDPTKVTAVAARASQSLQEWLRKRSAAPYDANTVRDLYASIRSLPEQGAISSWDEAAQRYLALVPLSQSLHALAPSGDDAPRGAELKNLRDYLRYPNHYDSPKANDPTKAPSVR
jgi:hypothetical protein